MADELDVMRVKATELSKLEATVEKYKQKLDQAASARQHIKDLGDQNSKYLDQVCMSVCMSVSMYVCIVCRSACISIDGLMALCVDGRRVAD